MSQFSKMFNSYHYFQMRMSVTPLNYDKRIRNFLFKIWYIVSYWSILEFNNSEPSKNFIILNNQNKSRHSLVFESIIKIKTIRPEEMIFFFWNWIAVALKFPSPTHFFYIKSSLIWHPLFYNIESPWSFLIVLKNSGIEDHNPSRVYEYCPWSTMYHTPFIDFWFNGFNGHVTSQGHSSHITIADLPVTIGSAT